MGRYLCESVSFFFQLRTRKHLLCLYSSKQTCISFISLEAVAKKLHVNLSKVIVYNCCPAVPSLGGISRRGMRKTHPHPPLYGALQFVTIRLRTDANNGVLLGNLLGLEFLESVW